MSDKFMVEQVIKYSDGTETVISYKENENAQKIEAEVAEAQAEVAEEVVEESAPEEVVEESKEEEKVAE